VNKRFYPGGDSSIRGYQQDEASPRGPDGRFIGAETYTLLNIELEQAITNTWSVVVFGDALGEAAALADYPWDERLYSVGLGVRYQTIVGPVRLEYGRNVNPRPGDPSGTLHFSVGFPF
jgi:outer membrane protein insertion porin family